MFPPPRFSRFAWLLVALACSCFVLWSAQRRVARIDYVSAATGETLATDPGSATGYVEGKRWLILPEGNAGSYGWIAQTQQMHQEGAWRVRSVTYDNAPKGRAVAATSPYRWWYSTIARVTGVFSSLPAGASVERAALYAEPALQVLLIFSASALVAWSFGSGLAAFTAAALTLLFPLNSFFLPGQPGPAALALTFGCASVLLLAAGASRATRRSSRTRLCFLLSGFAGGFALWTDASSAAGLVLAITLAAAVAVWRSTRDAENTPVLPWLTWSLAGAGLCCLAFLFEKLPGLNGSFRGNSLSLLHVLGWLGAGVSLRQLALIRGNGNAFTRPRLIALLAGGAAWLGAVVAAVVIDGESSGVALITEARFSKLAGNVSGTALWDWFSGGGSVWILIVLLLPVAGVLGLARMCRTSEGGRKTESLFGVALALLGCVLALFVLSAWAQANLGLLAAALLLCATPALAAPSQKLLRFAPAVLVALLLPGALPLITSSERADAPMTESDVQALMERDLAHWLANQSGGTAVVLASPTLGTSLFYHGGLRVIASVYRENAEGLAAALRISSTNRQDEAYALAQSRQITHVVSASWDRFLEEYARRTSGQANNTFIELLEQWLPPRWLRPVAYEVPQIPGLPKQSVLLYETVELQEQGVALSRLAEYFIELGLINNAAAVVKTLEEHFPKDLSGGVARAQFGIAVNEPERFVTAMNATLADLTPEAFQALPFDRKISFVLALARAERFDILRELMPPLIAECEPGQLRSLSPSHLFRLIGILRALGLQLPPPLAETARGLLPPELRAKI